MNRVINYFMPDLDDVIPRYRAKNVLTITLCSMLSTGLYLMYLLIANLLMPSAMSEINRIMLAGLSGFMLMCCGVLLLVRHGSVMPASLLWLVTVISVLVGVSVPDFEVSAQHMFTALMVAVIAAGMLLPPIWAMTITVLITALEVGLVLTVPSTMTTDMLVGSASATMISGLIIWVATTSWINGEQERESLRRHTARLQHLAKQLNEAQMVQLSDSGLEMKGHLDQIGVSLDFIEQAIGQYPQNKEALLIANRRLFEAQAVSRTMIATAHIQTHHNGTQDGFFNPIDVLKGIAISFGRLALFHGIDFRCAVEIDVPGHLQGDDTAFQHAVVQVIKYALRYTAQGNIALYAWIRDDQQWSLSVTDTGSGIPTQTLEALRIRHPDGPESDPDISKPGRDPHAELALARELIEAMGGKMTIANNKEGGTQVTMTFPLEPKE